MSSFENKYYDMINHIFIFAVAVREPTVYSLKTVILGLYNNLIFS